MEYLQKPQKVIALQFPEEATITFPASDPESTGPETFLLTRTDWLVFLPTGEKRVVEHKDFCRQFTPCETPTAIPARRTTRKPRAGLNPALLTAEERDGGSREEPR